MNGRGVRVLLVACIALLASCNALPPAGNRQASSALTDTGNTKLGVAIAPLVQAHPGVSGIYPLTSGRDAFAARVLLADAAQRSLDVQYYIWHDDMTGRMLFDALRAAADRGVRVRLLLDDNNTVGLDPILASLIMAPLMFGFGWVVHRLLISRVSGGTLRESATICVEQKRPILTPGVQNVASSAATARSQVATSWQPAAVAVPCTAAITGFGQRTIERIRLAHWRMSLPW